MKKKLVRKNIQDFLKTFKLLCSISHFIADAFLLRKKKKILPKKKNEYIVKNTDGEKYRKLMCRGGNGTEKRDKKKNSIKKVWLKYLKKASFGVINSRRERERERD